MSAAVGAVSSTKDVAFSAHLEEDHKNKQVVGELDQLPYSDCAKYDDAEETDQLEEEEEDSKLELDLGPQFSLKEQLEKDKVSFFFKYFFFIFYLQLLISYVF